MALLSILCYPDPKLHTVAKPVQAVDARIKKLVADMLDTMYDANGIGLAASQVNVHERVIVIDVSEQRSDPLVLINPAITWASEEKQFSDEGCLSVPGVYDGVERAAAIKVMSLDGQGHSRTIEAEGSRRIHGHTYYCEVALSGTPNQNSGMVSDLGLLQAHLEAVRDQLDHHYLDEVEGLGVPTLENLCIFIWRAVEPKFSNIAGVHVWREGMGDSCRLRR